MISEGSANKTSIFSRKTNPSYNVYLPFQKFTFLFGNWLFEMKSPLFLFLEVDEMMFLGKSGLANGHDLTMFVTYVGLALNTS